MARLHAVLLGGLGLLLVQAGVAVLTVEWLWPSQPQIDGPCEAWLEKPVPASVRLRGCLLDVQQAVLESDTGQFETLEDRRQGMSRQLHEKPLRWVAVWLPVTTAELRSERPRAVFRLQSSDVMRWLNELEVASEPQRSMAWAQGKLLQRLSQPPILIGVVRGPVSTGLKGALKVAGKSPVLTIDAGDPFGL